jgi:hypothetical protein
MILTLLSLQTRVGVPLNRGCAKVYIIPRARAEGIARGRFGRVHETARDRHVTRGKQTFGQGNAGQGILHPVGDGDWE